MSITRRAFLQIVGIGGTLSGFNDIFGMDAQLHQPIDAVLGRVLYPTALYVAPDSDKSQHLWEQDIIQITGRVGDWYQTPTGYIKQQAVQPILSYPAHDFAPLEVRQWAQVVSPIASIRAYCDPQAPIITHIGQGGVMWLCDHLEYAQTGDWYEVGDADGKPLGWTQAIHWRAVPKQQHKNHSQTITINRAAYHMTINGISIPINLPESLKAGQYRLVPVCVGGITNDMACGTSYYGVPYVMQIGNHHPLHGVYWHNQYGTTHSSIELPAWLASTLWFMADSDVEVM